MAKHSSLLFLLILLLFFSSQTLARETSRVAAAADLQVALPKIQQAFEAQYPEYRLQITYGSSGVFASQLRQGAPFELYFSANADYVRILHEAGLTQDAGTDYAQGKLAFYSLQPLKAETAEEALKLWLEANPQGKLSIANPSHAPYGVAAIGWLEHLELSLPSSRLVRGENAAQSVQFVLSGAASAGIVAWPLIYPRDLSGQAWLIPEEDHPPLQQRMVLMNTAGPAAAAFYAYLQEPEVIAKLQSFGFGAP
ncbi:molybdate transport system substrate-binding protein [Marinospirillum celere]|uniref:Molybdate transport system substrate-binding protein n=1 Tax=Marinospirillum celere TaxID=1122252 RepID=A0A1I1JS28_9GAMM|nr:molybdate ABC transporter substrate-binding protein [Marinospirillum celere]SFC51364.1 molybdate transport system substrate-binding protein [Marinospirillum celere]